MERTCGSTTYSAGNILFAFLLLNISLLLNLALFFGPKKDQKEIFDYQLVGLSSTCRVIPTAWPIFVSIDVK